MMKYLVIGFLLFLMSTTIIKSQSQPLSIEWQQCYGGNNYDAGYSILKTNIGYLLFCGTDSNDGDIAGNHGKSDYWVLSVDSLGNILWSKTYGGMNDDLSSQMLSCGDKEYILFGSTSSTDGDITDQHGGNDYWAVKIDSIGGIIWQRCLGGSCTDLADKICMSADSDYYYCIGYSCSTDGDVTGNKGIYDLWIVKLNRNGSIKWERSFGSSEIDWGQSLTATSDGGVIVGGLTGYEDEDVQCTLHGNYDSWLLKLDSTGTVAWQHCYGGSNDENVNGIVTTNDGGYIFVGQTSSNDGDVSGNHGANDIWAVKIDSLGDLKWQHCFGGSQNEYVSFIKPSIDGNFYIGGSTFSNDGDVHQNHSIYPYFQDMWLIKITPLGNLLWQICLGGDGDDFLNDVLELSSGKILLLGSTRTDNSSGNVYCNHHGPGTYDAWILSLSDTTNFGNNEIKGESSKIEIVPNPAIDEVTFQYSLDRNSLLNEIVIFDELGNVITIISLPDHEGNIQWNTKNINSGIYYYRVRNDRFSKSGKIVIL